MEVLILSKTKYGQSQYCIGGLSLTDNKFIRLLNPGGYYQPIDTQLKIGDIWEISFTPSYNTRPPHNEDVIVNSKRFVIHIYNLKTFLNNQGVKIWKDSILNIFDGHLKWTGAGSGFLSENQTNLPSNSVGFWIPDQDLQYNNGYYYIDNKKLNYKGAVSPQQIIAKGSLIRLSLAKWWCPEDFYESRCYLQLSGVYVDKPIPAAHPPIKKQETFQDIERLRKQLEDSKTSQSYTKPTYSSPSSNKNTSGSCYIATACYGGYYADEVCEFRDFRDFTLNKHILGRQFIRFYYKYSPNISEKLEKKKIINKAVKLFLLSPLLFGIRKMKWNKEKTHPNNI